MIKKHSNKKTPFFAKELNTSIKNIERWIKQLKDENKIEFRVHQKLEAILFYECIELKKIANLQIQNNVIDQSYVHKL